MTLKFDHPIHVTRPLIPNVGNALEKIEEIFESKWLTNNGMKHQELESSLEKHLEVENLSLFTNGTMALLLGLKALNLSGEVITTPFTFPATTQTLDWNGLTPVFCDIDPVTLNIDADKIEEYITEKTSAILAVHVFGNPCEVEKIQNIAEKYNLKVIYDGAHAFGTKVNDNPIAIYGDMTMFSFHATKLFNTIEGGAIAFKDVNLKEKLNQLKNFGLKGKEEVALSGLNAKLNEIQAGVGLEVLKIVDEERLKRHRIKRTYEKTLADIPGVRIVTTLENEESSYQYFIIEINEEKFGKSRDFVHKELEKYNVFTRKYFNPLCSDFEWYQDLESAKPNNLPNAHKTVKQVLSMPYYGDLEISSVEKISTIINHIQKM